MREHYDGLTKKPQDIVIGDPGPKDMFDDRVYKSGAITLHALRVSLGDEAFFAAVRRYVAAGRHSLVEPADLRAELGDVDAVWDAWLNEPALPECPQ